MNLQNLKYLIYVKKVGLGSMHHGLQEEIIIPDFREKLFSSSLVEASESFPVAVIL
jgi:hypothetical protein